MLLAWLNGLPWNLLWMNVLWVTRLNLLRSWWTAELLAWLYYYSLYPWL
jgi:hypothetical protein